MQLVSLRKDTGPMVQVALAKDDKPVNSKVKTGYMAACGQILQGLRSPKQAIFCTFTIKVGEGN